MRDEAKPTDLVQGTLHMLILKTLALEPKHAYGIGIRIGQISKGVFLVNAGSLFPALRRLERDGLIKATGGSPRKPPREGLPPHRSRTRQIQARGARLGGPDRGNFENLKASLGEL